MVVQKEVENAVAKIVKVPLKKVAADGTAPFNAFRTAVTKASAEAKRTETSLDDLMGVVVERREVLSFLIHFFAVKKMYRKQITATMVTLLEMEIWANELKEDKELMGLLPEELHELLEDHTQPDTFASLAEATSPIAIVVDDKAAGSRAGSSKQAGKASPTKAKEFTPEQREAFEKELEVSVSKVMTLGAGSNDAFNSFKRAILKAERDRTLYGRLEPKDALLDFLVEVHEQKRAYRKQVEHVFSILLQSAPWLQSLRMNVALLEKLPAEMAQMEKDAVMPVVATGNSFDGQDDEGAAAAASMRGDASADGAGGAQGADLPVEPDVDIRSAVEAAKEANRRREEEREKHGNPGAKDKSDPAQVVRDSHYMLLAQVSRAGSPEQAAAMDDGSEAFEDFRRGVTLAAKTEVDGRLVIDDLEPKRDAIVFMLALHEKKQKLRSRIMNLLDTLKKYPGWASEMTSDAKIERDMENARKRVNKMVRTGGGAQVNLTKRAQELILLNPAENAGVLCVKILAGTNLVYRNQFGTSDPFVRVKVGRQLRQTKGEKDALNPVWQENPFLFDVKKKEQVFIEVYDGSNGNDIRMGHLWLNPAQCSTDLGEPQRHELEGVEHGYLEFELTYEGNEESFFDEEAAKAKEERGENELTFKLMERAIDMLSVQDAGEDVKVYQHSELRCPNGHPVTKKKKGLQWHQLLEVLWTQQSCNLCHRQIGINDIRWRCNNHCDYDVCQTCYDRVHFGTNEIKLSDLQGGFNSRRSVGGGAISGPIIKAEAGGLAATESTRNLVKAPSSRTSGKSYRSAHTKKEKEANKMKSKMSHASEYQEKGEEAPLEYESLDLDVSEIDMPEEGIEERSGVIYFAVDVLPESDGPPWRVWRRFHDFNTLADRLGHFSRSYEEAPFPSKSMPEFPQFEDLDERRTFLQTWLKKMIHRKPMPRVWERPLQDFCGHEDPEPLYEEVAVGATFMLERKEED